MNLGKATLQDKYVIGCGVSLTPGQCGSLCPFSFSPAQPINNGRSLTSTLSTLTTVETYYSVTHLYFSSLKNNVCAIIVLEKYG